jgi:hypothetical protein
MVDCDQGEAMLKKLVFLSQGCNVVGPGAVLDECLWRYFGSFPRQQRYRSLP